MLTDAHLTEMTQLRKAGKLHEAEALLTGIDIAQCTPKARGTVAWLYYARCREALKACDTSLAQEYYRKFEELELDHNQYNVLIYEQMAKLHEQLNHPEQVRFAKLVEEGRFEAAWELSAQPGQTIPEQDLAWSIEKGLKAIKDNVPNKPGTTATKAILERYIQCQIERPSLVHSLICVFLVKDLPQLQDFDFARWFDHFGLNSLRAEDFEPKTINDKTFSSLAEEVVRVYGKSLLSRFSLAPEQIEGYEQMVARAGHGLWPTYYLAQLYLKHGHTDRGFSALQKVGKEKPNEPWIWAVAAGYLSASRTHDAISFFVRALQLKPLPDYEVKIRLSLAQLLHAIGQNAWAAAELAKINTDSLKAKTLDHHQWLHSQVANVMPMSDDLLRQRYEAAALHAMKAFDPDGRVVVGAFEKTYQNKEGQKIGVIWAKTENGIKQLKVKKGMLKKLRGTNAGSLVELFIAGSGRILELKRREGDVPDFWEEFSGMVLGPPSNDGRVSFLYASGKSIRITLPGANPGQWYRLKLLRSQGPKGEQYLIGASEGPASAPKGLDFVKVVNGNLQRLPNGHGKVGNEVFVLSQRLPELSHVPSGGSCQVLAAKTLDPKRQREGWIFVSLAPEDE